MHVIVKHKLLIGVVALVAAASAGGAYAATQSGTNSRQAFFNDVANRLHVSPAQLRSAVQGAFFDRLDAAVKAGMLTQAQADRIKQRIQQNGGLPFLRSGGLGLRRLGPYGHFGPPAPHGFFGRPGRIAGPLGAAAQYLGVTDAQLLRDLGSGRSLAQIAKSRGKSVSGLEQAMVGAVRSRLDRLASAGLITKAQEQRLLGRLSARINKRINQPALGPAPAGSPATDPGPGPGDPAWGPPAPGAPQGPASGGLPTAPPPGV